MAETIADIGELQVIERLKPFCAEGMGDDGALVDVALGHRLVVTTDVLVDEVHFSDRTTPPHSVGWRATAANLSDLAAMGAMPLGITIGLGLPPQTAWPWVEELYSGISDCLKQYGGAIVGGDLCRANQRTVSITALGQVLPEQTIYRATARPGMAIVVTGCHGLSRAGLALLTQEIAGDVDAPWVKAHQYPVPRFDAIAHLQTIYKSIDSAWAIAGMDSSDGLANALLQISRSSKVGIDILQDRLSMSEDLAAFVGAEKALEWTLYGGEDFELVLCLPPEIADRFVAMGAGASVIGTTTENDRVRLIASDGSGVSIEHQSFRHF